MSVKQPIAEALEKAVESVEQHNADSAETQPAPASALPEPVRTKWFLEGTIDQLRGHDEEHMNFKRFQAVMDEKGDDPTALQTLLDEGLSVNTSSQINMNITSYAAYKGFPKCIKFLIERGGDALTKDDVGSSALCKAGQYQFVHNDASLRMIESLCGVKLEDRFYVDDRGFPHISLPPRGANPTASDEPPTAVAAA
mmetsp:Transcript_24375/g.40327  ORF Transcript_24375/g.40327 Transcript_24375/m.40327 type:complete len:197 (+) Transcript_24375:72-662(+)